RGEGALGGARRLGASSGRGGAGVGVMALTRSAASDGVMALRRVTATDRRYADVTFARACRPTRRPRDRGSCQVTFVRACRRFAYPAFERVCWGALEGRG